MDRRGWLAVLAGALAPFAASCALVVIRDRLDNTTIALLLVVVIVAVATTGRRIAAATAALSSATAFNLFFTHPYLSLRIDSSRDFETGVALLLVGLAVGELAAMGRRFQRTAADRSQALARFQGLAGQVALDETSDFVVMSVAVQLSQQLDLRDCRFEREWSDDRAVPSIRRDGTVWWGVNQWNTRQLGLPPWGVELPVWGHGRQLGRFLLEPSNAEPVEPDVLVPAVVLADQAGAALAASLPAA